MKELLASDDEEEKATKVEKAYVPKLTGKNSRVITDMVQTA